MRQFGAFLDGPGTSAADRLQAIRNGQIFPFLVRPWEETTPAFTSTLEVLLSLPNGMLGQLTTYYPLHRLRISQPSPEECALKSIWMKRAAAKQTDLLCGAEDVKRLVHKTAAIRAHVRGTARS